MTPKEAYSELLEISRRVAIFSSFGSLLGWDQRTYMPKKAANYRALQYASLMEYIYEILTSDRFGKLIEIAEKGEYDLRGKMNIYWWRRGYDRLTKIPKSLYVEEARVSSESESVWVEAKKKGDFNLVKPYLEKAYKH